jgi:hypothetical protein
VSHPEVPIKVTAWVDEGVAPLVAALNSLDGVMTLDSCQGDSEKGAYVLFRYRDKGPLQFVADLARVLGGSCDEYLLRAEWRPGTVDSLEPLLELVCPPDQVAPLAKVIGPREEASGG